MWKEKSIIAQVPLFLGVHLDRFIWEKHSKNKCIIVDCGGYCKHLIMKIKLKKKIISFAKAEYMAELLHWLALHYMDVSNVAASECI